MAAVDTQPVLYTNRTRRGMILPLAMMLLVILGILGFSLLRVSAGAHEFAVQQKCEAAAMSAAEAACEKAVFWMSQQTDIMAALQDATVSDSLVFPDSSASYEISFADFVGYRPVYEITSRGRSGIYERTVRLHVVQAISGWEMGLCRVPGGPTSTYEVNFSEGEVIDMPIHINSNGDPEDFDRDIYLTGDPTFLRSVSMGESRYAYTGTDKYKNLMYVFDNGIYFNQPQSRINNEDTVETKLDFFRGVLEEQNPALIFQPVKNKGVTNGLPAVQLEFFVDSTGTGCIRVTNNCTVRSYLRTGSSSNSWDYRVTPGSGGTQYEKYPIYGYHYIPSDAETSGQRYIISTQSTEVVPTYQGMEAPPGGQIFVEGNVIIGSADENASEAFISALNTVQGRVTVAATGNIWIADSITVSDRDNEGEIYPRKANGLPGDDNPNVLGLVAQGVIKVVDPGMVEDLGGPAAVSNAEYEPIAIQDGGYWAGWGWNKTWFPAAEHSRHLPDPVIVEAGMTVGGGGWGAENVQRGSYGGRKETSGNTDDLVVRGTITEVIRGVVGLVGADGFNKQYYLDERLLNGIIPGNIYLKGKFIPTPAGWDEYRERLD